MHETITHRARVGPARVGGGMHRLSVTKRHGENHMNMKDVNSTKIGPYTFSYDVATDMWQITTKSMGMMCMSEDINITAGSASDTKVTLRVKVAGRMTFSVTVLPSRASRLALYETFDVSSY